MNIDFAIQVLRVMDVSRSIEWYRDVLDFKADPFPDNPPYAFAILENGSTRIMLRREPGPVRDPQWEDWDVYIGVSGVDIHQLHDDLRARAHVTRELERMPYGIAEFDVRDPDGYILCISETVSDGSGLPHAAQ